MTTGVGGRQRYESHVSVYQWPPHNNLWWAVSISLKYDSKVQDMKDTWMWLLIYCTFPQWNEQLLWRRIPVVSACDPPFQSESRIFQSHEFEPETDHSTSCFRCTPFTNAVRRLWTLRVIVPWPFRAEMMSLSSIDASVTSKRSSASVAEASPSPRWPSSSMPTEILLPAPGCTRAERERSILWVILPGPLHQRTHLWRYLRTDLPSSRSSREGHGEWPPCQCLDHAISSWPFFYSGSVHLIQFPSLLFSAHCNPYWSNSHVFFIFSSGLCGFYDGDKSNDARFRNGSIVIDPELDSGKRGHPDDLLLHYRYGSSTGIMSPPLTSKCTS